MERAHFSQLSRILRKAGAKINRKGILGVDKRIDGDTVILNCENGRIVFYRKPLVGFQDFEYETYKN